MAQICSRETKEGEWMPIGEIIGVVSETVKETTKEMVKETKKVLKSLDKPLNASEITDIVRFEENYDSWIKEYDKPLNSESETKAISKSESEVLVKNTEGHLSNDISKTEGQKNMSNEKTLKDVNKMEKMEPQITIEFNCPEGVDKKEFIRQLKGQERGLNSQTVAENMDNRAAFEQRKMENGNGRDLSEGKKAQEIAREKALQNRIETNQKNGMSYSDAKAEAEQWIKNQAALHNPDQIAGGDPGKVSRMGDANVNSSIGSQWRTRVQQLATGVEDFAKDKTRAELENTKMNVKLVAI